MEKNINKIKLVLISYLFVMVGIIGLICFINNMCTSEYSLLGLITYAFGLSLILCILFVFVKWKWIIWIAAVAIMLIWGYLYKYQIAGGFCLFINSIIEKFAVYYNCELYFFDLSKRLKYYADESVLIYLLVSFLVIVFSYCITNRKLLIFPCLLSLTALIIPIIIEEHIKGFFIVYQFSYIISMLVLQLSYRCDKEMKKTLSVQRAALVMGAITFACGLIVINVKPESNYKRANYFEDVKNDFSRLIDKVSKGTLNWEDLGIFKSANENKTIPSQIGGGRLGQTDSLNFSHKPVLRANVALTNDTVYIAGYYGQDYHSTGWDKPSISGYEDLFNDIRVDGFTSQSYMFNLINKYGNTSPETRYYSYTSLVNLGNYNFYPIYSSADILECNGDCGIDREEKTVSQYKNVTRDDILKINIDENYDDKLLNAENEYRNYVYSKYLDVNTSCAKELYETWGNTLNDETQNMAIKRFIAADEIKEYLFKNCHYSTTPGKVPENKDFVEYFLYETHEGYCTYFATAAVMMLRSAGIPARYVEGYAFIPNKLKQPDVTDSTFFLGEKYGNVEVLDSNAHAWVEFYIDGIGWVDYDFTPGGQNSNSQNPTQTETESTTTETTIQETTTGNEVETTTHADIKESTTSNEVTKVKKIKISEKTIKSIILIFVIMLIILIILLSIIIRHKIVVIKYEKMYNGKDDASNKNCILLNYKRLLKMLKEFGYIRRIGEDYETFAVRVEKECSFIGTGEVLRLTSLYEKVIFSEESISNAEKEESENIVNSIRNRIYENMGVLRKVIFTYIRNN